ncbi:hypothetical protein AcW1_005577 [Taiwanofungus camphoratus]|nr:hypothetical protein AcV7_009111 [Antrodia cinnamomea]KAI0957073.1 hypothetical protein AcW1_005577 [Antrodia cinnamomea]
MSPDEPSSLRTSREYCISPSPTRGHYRPKSLVPSLPTPELVGAIASGAHYAGVLSPGSNDHRKHVNDRRTQRASSVDDPGVIETYQEVMEDLKELFCGRPTPDMFERRWRKDAVFEDPFIKCVGFREYAAQWYGVSQILSASEQVSCRILLATLSPNRLVYSQTQRYTTRLFGYTKTLNSIIVVDLDEDLKIIHLVDKWNAKELPTRWLWLRRLIGKTTSLSGTVPKARDRENI